MAVAKPAAPATDVKPEPAAAAPETTPIDDAGLTEKITAVVKQVLGEMGTDKPAAPATDVKPIGPREEEARTRSIVAEAIAALKEQIKGEEPAAKPAAKETETPPGTKTGRWIEKHLWGAE